MPSKVRRRLNAVLADLLRAALDDAMTFTEEFEKPLDPARTDWDAAAWADTLRQLRGRHEIDQVLADKLWPLYQQLLVLGVKHLVTLPSEERSRKRDEVFEAVAAVTHLL